jgi:hypothetical protein
MAPIKVQSARVAALLFLCHAMAHQPRLMRNAEFVAGLHTMVAVDDIIRTCTARAAISFFSTSNRSGVSAGMT